MKSNASRDQVPHGSGNAVPLPRVPMFFIAAGNLSALRYLQHNVLDRRRYLEILRSRIDLD